jgi:hypothetical protein
MAFPGFNDVGFNASPDNSGPFGNQNIPVDFAVTGTITRGLQAHASFAFAAVALIQKGIAATAGTQFNATATLTNGMRGTANSTYTATGRIDSVMKGSSSVVFGASGNIVKQGMRGRADMVFGHNARLTRGIVARASMTTNVTANLRSSKTFPNQGINTGGFNESANQLGRIVEFGPQTMSASFTMFEKNFVFMRGTTGITFDPLADLIRIVTFGRQDTSITFDANGVMPSIVTFGPTTAGITFDASATAFLFSSISGTATSSMAASADLTRTRTFDARTGLDFAVQGDTTKQVYLFGQMDTQFEAQAQATKTQVMGGSAQLTFTPTGNLTVLVVQPFGPQTAGVSFDQYGDLTINKLAVLGSAVSSVRFDVDAELQVNEGVTLNVSFAAFAVLDALIQKHIAGQSEIAFVPTAQINRTRTMSGSGSLEFEVIGSIQNNASGLDPVTMIRPFVNREMIL